jgi:haloalkane dehalogenase
MYPSTLVAMNTNPVQSRCVVLNTWCFPHGDDPRVRRLSRLVASPLGRFLYLGLNASPRFIVPMSFARRERLRPEVHRHYVMPFSRFGSRRAPFVLGCDLAGSDPFYARLWEGRAALQRVPVTLLWGMADPAFGPAYLARLHAALPDAHVVELPDVGHFPQEEAPDAVTEAIERAARARA